MCVQRILNPVTGSTDYLLGTDRPKPMEFKRVGRRSLNSTNGYEDFRFFVFLFCQRRV